MINNLPFQLELIKWIDSCYNSDGWNDLENGTISPCYIYSCGKIIKETDDYIVIAPHYAPKEKDVLGSTESSCGEMAIPKCAIVARMCLPMKSITESMIIHKM